MNALAKQKSAPALSNSYGGKKSRASSIASTLSYRSNLSQQSNKHRSSSLSLNSSKTNLSTIENAVAILASVSQDNKEMAEKITICKINSRKSKLRNLSKKKVTISETEMKDDSNKNTILSYLDLNVDEEKLLLSQGYSKTRKICATLQGAIYEGIEVNTSKRIVIKKTDKTLHNESISIQNDMNIVVEEDIMKEAVLLHHLTVENKPTSDYIAKFVAFFESACSYYLIMEYCGDTNLEEFCKKAHQYINEGKLKIKEWKKIVKYLFWQIAVIVYWLHNDMNCCHLDLTLSNIVLLNGKFINNKDGSIGINPNIKIKLADFGLAEMFKRNNLDEIKEEEEKENDDDNNANDDDDDEDEEDEYIGNDFKCSKFPITDKFYLNAPKVYDEEIHDARKSDIWALGIILYELATGIEPYKQHNINDDDYYKVRHSRLIELITSKQKGKYVNMKMVDLMSKLLNVRENERYSVPDLIKHEWLKLYYTKYCKQIAKKSKTQKFRNKLFVKKMERFPFYKFR